MMWRRSLIPTLGINSMVGRVLRARIGGAGDPL
jgi:hypothetical protein